MLPGGSSPLTRGKQLVGRDVGPVVRLIPAHAGKTSRDSSTASKEWAHPRSRGENSGASTRTDPLGGSSPLTRGKPRDVLPSFGAAGLIPAHAGKTPASRRRGPSERAHPRSRGENFAGGVDFGGAGGSSPLTRGKLAAQPVDALRRGLIPAHAGKTQPTERPSHEPWAHPRSRGENSHSMTPGTSCGGSSPLTRGKLLGADEDAFAGGLIPAHAGKTLGMRTPASSRWAHPRSRGENMIHAMRACCALGSSPLTRGKQATDRDHHRIAGLIPAHAGKTSRGCLRSWSRWAHPRSRGENLRLYGLGAMNEGSSPLTRGKRGGGRRSRRGGRLIPAHAGKTPASRRRGPSERAHPRSRGENSRGRRGGQSPGGSSPLTRGKRRPRRVVGPPRGLIPAHAGKTTARVAWWSCLRAHPRSRGENFACVDHFRRVRGSSPLTRGKPRRIRDLHARTGLIPAHAGKTCVAPDHQRGDRAHPRSRGENTGRGRVCRRASGSSPLTRGKLVL